MNWLWVFLFSLVIDMGAVLYTASISNRDQIRWQAVGVGTTMLIATVNWLSVFLVVGEDHRLMIPSIIGHAVGYVAGGRFADYVESRK